MNKITGILIAFFLFIFIVITLNTNKGKDDRTIKVNPVAIEVTEIKKPERQQIKGHSAKHFARINSSFDGAP
ncbi:MAG: hypothetical protein HZA15_11105 [Nitrospirae bacterium]|nr:hypothetical protein [Nitrospirota bacterium]